MIATLQKGSPGRLDRVILWSTLSLALFAPKVYADAVGGAGWRAWIFLAAILLHVGNLLWCRRLLRLGEFGRALKRTLWGSLLMFTVGAAHSDNNPSTAVLPVLLAAIALPHLEERPFVRYALLCFGALLLNLLVAALWPMQVSESPLETAAGHIFATCAASGVAMLLFWQVKLSLQRALEAKTRARANAQVEEDRYRQVLEGTGDGFWLLNSRGDTLELNQALAELIPEARRSELAGILAARRNSGIDSDFELSLPAPDGSLRWVSLSAAEVEGEGLLVLATEITEIKQARGRIDRSLGVEAEGRLAGGITHDMNNVLAVLRGSCDLLQSGLNRLGSRPQASAALRQIQDSVAQASSLVSRLLAGPSALAGPPRRGEADAGTAGQGLKRVLLVDDDDDVRGMSARALRQEGFDVLEASGADGARKIMQSFGDSIGLLVSDLMMPGTPGNELAAELKRSHPYLRVLFISGYAGELLGGQEGAWPEGSFLAKPFSAAELCGWVKKAML